MVKIRVKETAFGRDILDVLIEKQLQQVKFRELDVTQAISTVKSYLVKEFAPKKDEYPSKLKFLYPVNFDSARVLIAEYIAEFFQTGKIAVSELDTDFWLYTDHEIRQIILTEKEVDTLLRVLRKVQNPDHDMYARWKSQTERERWQAHIQAVYQVINQLK